MLKRAMGNLHSMDRRSLARTPAPCARPPHMHISYVIGGDATMAGYTAGGHVGATTGRKQGRYGRGQPIKLITTD